jgi:hypothetical protein
LNSTPFIKLLELCGNIPRIWKLVHQLIEDLTEFSNQYYCLKYNLFLKAGFSKVNLVQFLGAAIMNEELGKTFINLSESPCEHVTTNPSARSWDELEECGPFHCKIDVKNRPTPFILVGTILIVMESSPLKENSASISS